MATIVTIRTALLRISKNDTYFLKSTIVKVFATPTRRRLPFSAFYRRYHPKVHYWYRHSIHCSHRFSLSNSVLRLFGKVPRLFPVECPWFLCCVLTKPRITENPWEFAVHFQALSVHFMDYLEVCSPFTSWKQFVVCHISCAILISDSRFFKDQVSVDIHGLWWFIFMHLNTHHVSIEQPASKVSTCPSKESSHWASQRVRRPSSSRPPENRASRHASLWYVFATWNCFNAIIGSLLCQYIHEVKHFVSFMQFGRPWTKNTHRGLS